LLGTLLSGITAVDENGSITAVELIDGGSFTGEDQPGNYNLGTSDAALLLSASKQRRSTPGSSMVGNQNLAAAGVAAGLVVVAVVIVVAAAVVTMNRRAAAHPMIQTAHTLYTSVNCTVEIPTKIARTAPQPCHP
jgi:hypothetical protein